MSYFNKKTKLILETVKNILIILLVAVSFSLFFTTTSSAQPFLDGVGQDFNPNPPSSTGGDFFTNILQSGGSSNSQSSDNSYTLLAPFPQAGLETFNVSESCAFGRYADIMINLFIGIAAVLAMIQIVLGGLEYMTSELISGKNAGKGKIFNAVFGLLLALGAWLILNTINPNLLSLCLDTIPRVNIELEEDRETVTDLNVSGTTSAPAGPVKGCNDGIVKVETRGGDFYACKDISKNLQLMINTAWASGYQISGSGYRSPQGQIQKRIRNCGGNSAYNIYTKASRDCRPPTARPGTSRHEVGKAFDLRCSGSGITSRSNRCFDWLAANAHRWGLYNFPKEPWHWSVDGR